MSLEFGGCAGSIDPFVEVGLQDVVFSGAGVADDAGVQDMNVGHGNVQIPIPGSEVTFPTFFTFEIYFIFYFY